MADIQDIIDGKGSYPVYASAEAAAATKDLESGAAPVQEGELLAVVSFDDDVTTVYTRTANGNGEWLPQEYDSSIIYEPGHQEYRSGTDEHVGEKADLRGRPFEVRNQQGELVLKGWAVASEQREAHVGGLDNNPADDLPKHGFEIGLSHAEKVDENGYPLGVDWTAFDREENPVGTNAQIEEAIEGIVGKDITMLDTVRPDDIAAQAVPQNTPSDALFRE